MLSTEAASGSSTIWQMILTNSPIWPMRPTWLVSALSTRVVELSECTGAGCRELEDLPLIAGEPSQVAGQP